MSPQSPRANKSTGSPATPKQGVRAAISQKLLGWAPLRRWYVRRTLKVIDRSKAKGRPLPAGLAETARQLGRVPKQRRAEVLEEAILAERAMPSAGREFRRSAGRQRQSTRSEHPLPAGSAARRRGEGPPPRPR